MFRGRFLGYILECIAAIWRSKKIVMESLIYHEINLRRSIPTMSIVNPSGGDGCQDAVHVITVTLVEPKLN
jgi:hypothetical protein